MASELIATMALFPGEGATAMLLHNLMLLGTRNEDVLAISRQAPELTRVPLVERLILVFCNFQSRC